MLWFEVHIALLTLAKPVFLKARMFIAGWAFNSDATDRMTTNLTRSSVEKVRFDVVDHRLEATSLAQLDGNTCMAMLFKDRRRFLKHERQKVSVDF